MKILINEYYVRWSIYSEMFEVSRLLRIAVEIGDVEIVQLLLTDLLPGDPRIQSALIVAEQYGRGNLVGVLNGWNG